MATADEMRLVAVYDTEDDARAAVRALERAGVDTARVRVADPRDHVAAIEGEMRGEVMSSVAGPGNVGPFTKEMTQGSLLGMFAGGAIGLVVALPFAAIDFGLEVWTRLLLLAIVGAVVGGTMGWVIGGGFGAKRPDEPLAAETGVTLAVEPSVPARQALMTTNARRIDIVEANGHAVDTLSQRDAGPEHIVRDIGRHMGGEERHG
jgi:hypothetical protein